MYEHREADRIPILDYAWEDTLARWLKEGLPTSDYYTYFDMDKAATMCTITSPRFPTEILEDNEKYYVVRNEWGRVSRFYKDHTTTPQDLSFAVNTPEEWLRIKDRMAFSDDRIQWDFFRSNYPLWKKEGRWISGALFFGFDVTHTGMVGTDTLLMAMIEEPDWVTDMFETELNLSLRLLERLWEEGFSFDELMWCDDLGYKNAQFFSMDMYRELLKPYHQRAIDWGHEHGCVVRMHSCGDVRPYVPEFISMGLDALNPLEVKAGMDPYELKRLYGDKIVLHGGVNAANFGKPDIILEELERLIPVMKENGGYIFASDHSIPASVSLEGYGKIIEAFKRLGSYI